MLKKTVSDSDIFGNYYLQKIDTSTSNSKGFGEFRVGVYENISNVQVGLVRGYNNMWRIEGDPTFEAAMLLKAVRKAIDNYNRYWNELVELGDSIKVVTRV